MPSQKTDSESLLSTLQHLKKGGFSEKKLLEHLQNLRSTPKIGNDVAKRVADLDEISQRRSELHRQWEALPLPEEKKQSGSLLLDIFDGLLKEARKSETQAEIEMLSACWVDAPDVSLAFGTTPPFAPEVRTFDRLRYEDEDVGEDSVAEEVPDEQTLDEETLCEILLSEKEEDSSEKISIPSEPLVVSEDMTKFDAAVKEDKDPDPEEETPPANDIPPSKIPTRNDLETSLAAFTMSGMREDAWREALEKETTGPWKLEKTVYGYLMRPNEYHRGGYGMAFFWAPLSTGLLSADVGQIRLDIVPKHTNIYEVSVWWIAEELLGGSMKMTGETLEDLLLHPETFLSKAFGSSGVKKL